MKEVENMNEILVSDKDYVIVYNENGMKLIEKKDKLRSYDECIDKLFRDMDMELSQIARFNFFFLYHKTGDMYRIMKKLDIETGLSISTIVMDNKLYVLKYPVENKKDGLELKVRYHHEIYGEFDHIKKIEQGDFIDLRCAKDTNIKPGEFKLIPLGISVEIPKGYYMELVPRSSTFKNFHILQANSIGIIDESYCGDDDLLFFPAYCPYDNSDVDSYTIYKNTRICQFRLVKKTEICITEVDKLENKNRGGFGSTGIN